MSKRLKLFLTFLKIGAFTFGGGYAMLPLITSETVEKNKWITEEDMLEVVAIAEATPGPIAVNSATFVGYKVSGFLGALLATLGVVLPSFTIISIISLILEQFRNFKTVEYAFFGIKAGVLALIVKALISVYKKSPKGIVPYLIIAVGFLISVLFDVNAIFIIIGSAVAGLIGFLFLERRAEK